MTNKQAIEWLIAIKKRYIYGGDEGFDELRKEALDMAVKALEEEKPQGECKSCGGLDEDAKQASIPYTYNAPKHDWKCGYPTITRGEK